MLVGVRAGSDDALLKVMMLGSECVVVVVAGSIHVFIFCSWWALYSASQSRRHSVRHP